MRNSTPHSRAFLSAIIGLLVAATVLGGITYGSQVTAALSGGDLSSSQAGRAAFVDAIPDPASTQSIRVATRVTASPTAPAPAPAAVAPTVQATQSASAVVAEYDDESATETKDD